MIETFEESSLFSAMNNTPFPSDHFDHSPVTDGSTDKESTVSLASKKKRQSKAKFTTPKSHQAMKFTPDQIFQSPKHRPAQQYQQISHQTMMMSSEEQKFKLALKRMAMKHIYQGLARSTRLLANHAILRFLKQYNLPLQVIEDPVFNRMLFFLSTTSETFHPSLIPLDH